MKIEVHATSKQRLGMTPGDFLRRYWQKHPVLIRGAFADSHDWIQPNDLAGLACIEGALSRLVIREAKRDRWKTRTGPFRETDFARLPKSHWTLLVQDVDKWDLDVAALLDQFHFVPSWRIDDVMVSYAVDEGGVGAHIDQYDVFLVQGRGRRRWRISTDPHAPDEFRSDVELKLLRTFAPTHEWVLEPGDALYLPPGIAHEGTALGECMTFSVGMRAPSTAELTLDFADHVAETAGDKSRYTDADLAPANGAEVDSAAIERVRRAMPHFSKVDNATLLDWFGRFITRYRAAHDAAPSPRKITQQQLQRGLATGGLMRNPWSRVAWARQGRGAQLFVAGSAWPCTLALARELCRAPLASGSALAKVAAPGDGWNVLTELVNAGHWCLVKAR